MDSKEINDLNLKRSQVLIVELVTGEISKFIFYSIYGDGITGYGMHEEGNELQYIPSSDIQEIKID